MSYHRVYLQLTRDARRLGGLHLWLVFRCLPALLLISLVLLLLATATPSQADPAEADRQSWFDDLESGHMLLGEAGAGQYTPAVMLASKAHFDINGLIATVSVEQRFRNNTKRWLEGVYAFPLPDKAAVRYLEMLIGERRIIGKIREKSAAKKIYQEAKAAGRKASLVEQQRPNMFSNRVANIAPGEEVVVRLEYVQEVAFATDTFSLRFPTTITPRYMPGRPLPAEPVAEEGVVLSVDAAVGWASPTDQVPDADQISPPLDPVAGSDANPRNPVTITARLDMGMPLASVTAPYHDIALARRAGVYDIRLAAGASEMDRDFVLSWQPVTGSAPSAALFTEQVGQEYFGLLMVLPPAAATAGTVASREIIFVVDTSGSMGGVSIEQARASVARALRQLRPEDRFNIIEFDSNHRSLFRRPMPATRHHVQQALEFVRLLRASGGTEMLPALRAALTRAPAAGGLREEATLRQVVFITDGAVGNETALFEEIAALVGSSRLFTVGIGSAPNSWFMRKAAEFGRGSHTHIGNVNEVEEKMGALFEQLSSPVAVNLQIDWPAPVEAWPERAPDLYRGQPLVQAVNFGTAPPRGEVQVSGELDGRVWSKRLQLATGADPESVPGHSGVASLWARHKIAGLLDLKVQGRDEAAVRADVLSVALQHQLLSPYTSFVAVEEVVSRPAGASIDSKALANSRPRGQSPQTFAYPGTATTGPARAWFGMLALFIAIIVRLVRQPEVDHVPRIRD